MTTDDTVPIDPPSFVRARIWDLPVRLVHWSLVLLIGFSWWSAEEGQLEWHRYSGYLIASLLLFRIYWGLVGSTTARFGHFVAGPRAIVDYLAGRGPARAGHNPLGGWSVIALLLVMTIQIGTGLFAVDVDGLESGPYSYLVSFEQGRSAAKVHGVAFTILQALVALHIAAILYYLIVRRDNLIAAMISGYKRIPIVGAAAILPGKWSALAMGLVGAGSLAWYLLTRPAF